MMRTKLERQSARIEAVLSLHKIPARVTGGTIVPRWVRFTILPAVGAKISKIRNLGEELATALDASSCRVSRRGVAVVIEIPRDDPQSVRFLPLYNQLTGQPTGYSPIPPVTAILGLAEDGAPLLIRLPSPNVGSVMIVGNEGSGKTTLLHTVLLSLAMSNTPAEIVFVLHNLDTEIGMTLRDFGYIVRDNWSDIRTAIRVIETGGLDNRKIILAVDDAETLEFYGDDLVIAANGCESHVYSIVTTDQPVLAGPFNVKIVGRVTNAKDARAASGWSGTGAERLNPPGDFVAIAEGRVTRFQSAYVSPDEIRRTLEDLGSPKLLEA